MSGLGCIRDARFRHVKNLFNGDFRPSTVIKPKFEQPVSGSGSRVSSKEIETVVLDPKVLIDRNERQTFRPRFDWRHEYIAVAMSTTISVLGVIE